MPKPNIRKFQESITNELDAIKNRVRDLIGNANWGEEGRYKEAILSKVISQFLPANLKIGTGFIMSNDDHLYGQNNLISTQIDIIIYEDKTPVIFREGDFVILTENAVRAVIEVKSKISIFSSDNENSLNKIVEKLNKLKQFKTFVSQEKRKKFVGIFSFDYSGSFNSNRVEEALIQSGGFINHISLGTNKFVRFWENPNKLNPPISRVAPCYIRYDLKNLSFSYFISNLLHMVADEDPVERYWFSFPIEGSKEMHRQDATIYLTSE